MNEFKKMKDADRLYKVSEPTSCDYFHDDKIYPKGNSRLNEQAQPEDRAKY